MRDIDGRRLLEALKPTSSAPSCMIRTRELAADRLPDGGGKTEAYLGPIASVLVLRCIRGQGKPHEGARGGRAPQVQAALSDA